MLCSACGEEIRGGAACFDCSAKWCQERDQARKLARWLFERTGFPERPAQVRELLRDHPWLHHDFEEGGGAS